MLSHADERLAARDRALGRGLRLLLDGEAFADALRRRLPDAGVDGAHATYVRYKPGTNCLVAYRIKVAGAEHDVYAKALNPGDRAKLEGAVRGADVSGPLGPGRLVLEDESVAVHFFPDDVKLKGLARFIGGEDPPESLRKLLPECPDLWNGRVETLRYKPERRFVARLVPESNVGGALLKLYTPSGFRAGRAGARAFGSHERLRVARLLGARERRAALSFEWVAGESLDEVLTRAEAGAAVERVGEALAELHAQGAEGLTRRSSKSEARALAGIARGLAHVVPPEGLRAASLAREISLRLSLEGETANPIHGDFYASQVLIEGDTVVVLDLDEASFGHPVSDLGNFIAHLERGQLRGLVGARRVEELREAVLEGYSRASGRRVAPGLLAAHTAAALLKLAHDPFRLREDGWPERTAAIIERAEEVLAGGRPTERVEARGAHAPGAKTSGKVTVSDPCAAADDPAMPLLRRALDPAEALEQLRATLEGREGMGGRVELRAIRVTRHKPGRRCLVEYDLTLARAGLADESLTLIGKARARGLDSRCFRLMEQLRAAGFDEGSRDGISVPEPVALVPDFQMWLQQKVPGAPSGEMLAGADGPRLSRRIAEAVVKLQRSGLVPGRTHTVEDELRTLRERLSVVAAERPAWRARLERLMTACLRLGASIPAARPVPAHRDFYPDQVLVHGERIYLLDFDLSASADPALDAGNFVAHLSEQSLRAEGDEWALADRERAMEERFAELTGGGSRARAAVRAYAALTLVRHVFISTRIPERRPFTETILEICERRLGVSRHTPPSHLSPTPKTKGISHASQNN